MIHIDNYTGVKYWFFPLNCVRWCSFYFSVSVSVPTGVLSKSHVAVRTISIVLSHDKYIQFHQVRFSFQSSQQISTFLSSNFKRIIAQVFWVTFHHPETSVDFGMKFQNMTDQALADCETKMQVSLVAALKRPWSAKYSTELSGRLICPGARWAKIIMKLQLKLEVVDSLIALWKESRCHLVRRKLE